MTAFKKRTDLCVDASLWVRFLTKETQTNDVDHLFELWLDEFNFFIAPSFLLFEIASAIRKKQKYNLLGPISVQEAMHQLYDLPILLFQSEDLLKITLETAKTMDETSVYDASYLSLALWKKIPFFTADQKFFRKAKQFYTDVHLV